MPELTPQSHRVSRSRSRRFLGYELTAKCFRQGVLIEAIEEIVSSKDFRFYLMESSKSRFDLRDYLILLIERANRNRQVTANLKCEVVLASCRFRTRNCPAQNLI